MKVYGVSRDLWAWEIPYLVKEHMGHTVSGVDCDHTVKVALGFFEKALR